tara:strand:- start:3800 stop:4483 length:684 start_codon:yes stop_codon:yes gene_type:complete
MSIKVKVSCPTCDKQIGGNDNSPSYYSQDFDDMIELFGISRKGKSHKQCKECFESAKEYQISDVSRMMEIDCMMCDKIVYNLVDAKSEFGFVKGEFRPRESCRKCRNTGDISDSIYDIKEDIIIDEYDNGTRRNAPTVVTGNTAEYHEAFKEIGGVFVRDLMDRDDSGWVFPNKKKGALITLLQKEKKVAKVSEKTERCEKCGSKQDDYGLYLICIKCGHMEHKGLE